MKPEPALAAPRHRGFTLIEVLVALAIVAFGLIAVFGQLNQSVTAANYLRNKTLAHWVAMNRLAELRLSGAFPASGTSSDEYPMANMNWRYEEKFSETQVASLRRVDITVALEADPDRPLATVAAFLGRPQPAPTSGGPGWGAIDPNAPEEPAPEASTAPTPKPGPETPPVPTPQPPGVPKPPPAEPSE